MQILKLLIETIGKNDDSSGNNDKIRGDRYRCFVIVASEMLLSSLITIRRTIVKKVDPRS